MTDDNAVKIGKIEVLIEKQEERLDKLETVVKVNTDELSKLRYEISKIKWMMLAASVIVSGPQYLPLIVKMLGLLKVM